MTIDGASMDKLLVTNIQRFSLHDGPGIRTTVFLKGCSVHCPWCCNPENISPKLQEYDDAGISKQWGRWYSVDELRDEILKDLGFYIGEISQDNYSIQDESLISSLPGGVTFSGGEALLQTKALIPLLLQLKENQIHIAVETSLFVPSSFFQEVIGLIDFFYVDMKMMDAKRCHNMIGGDMDLYQKNFQLLMESNRPVVVRIPIIGGFTDDEKNINDIYYALCEYHSHPNNLLHVELLHGHHLGDSKYENLGLQKPTHHAVDKERMVSMMEKIQRSGFKTVVNQI